MRVDPPRNAAPPQAKTAAAEAVSAVRDLRAELAQVSEQTRLARTHAQLEALGHAMLLARSQGRRIDGLAAEAARLSRELGLSTHDPTKAPEPEDGADLNI